jgi:hypothetical protein
MIDVVVLRFQRPLPDFYGARLNLGIAYQQIYDRQRPQPSIATSCRRAPPRFARERKGAAELLTELR